LITFFQTNLVEDSLGSFETAMKQAIEIYSDPTTFPRLKQYLREKIAEKLKLILNKFFNEEDKKFLNKPKEIKQIKQLNA